jgi:hypothetical protein
MTLAVETRTQPVERKLSAHWCSVQATCCRSTQRPRPEAHT